MRITNAMIEQAEARVAAERDAGIAAAQAALRGHGSPACVGCGEEIEPERRRALPSVQRCLDCQLRVERWKRRRSR